MVISCPSCNSYRVVKNGHTSNKKQQWICKKCNKRFLFNTGVSIRYRRTSLPFPFIARMLYFRKYMERKMNGKMPMKRFRKHINYHIWYLELKDILPGYTNDISRQTIHHWIKTYDNNLESIISFDEAKNFVDDLFKKTNDSNVANQRNIHIPVETVVFEKRKCKRKKSLELIQKVLGGKEKSLECLRNDKEYFDTFLEATSIIEIPKIKNVWKR